MEIIIGKKYRSKCRQLVLELDHINKGEEFILSDAYEDIDNYEWLDLHRPGSWIDMMSICKEQFELTFEEVGEVE